MPLVTLKCHRDIFPPDDPTAERSMWDAEQNAVVDLANELPEMIVSRSEDLMLEPGTVSDAVQVCIKKFHAWDVNTPQLWAVMLFSEEPDKDEQVQMRTVVKEMITQWLDQRGLGFTLAVDMLFGPTTGFFILHPGDEPTYW